MGYKEKAALEQARKATLAKLREINARKEREEREEKERKAQKAREELEEDERKVQAAAEDAPESRGAARTANNSRTSSSPINTNRSTQTSGSSETSAQRAARDKKRKTQEAIEEGEERRKIRAVGRDASESRGAARRVNISQSSSSPTYTSRSTARTSGSSQTSAQRAAEEQARKARKAQEEEAAAEDVRKTRLAARQTNGTSYRASSPIYKNGSPPRVSKSSKSLAQQAVERSDKVIGSRVSKKSGQASHKDALRKSKSAQQGQGECLPTSSRRVDQAPGSKMPVHRDEAAPSSSKRKAEEDADDRVAKRSQKPSWFMDMKRDSENVAGALMSAKKKQPDRDSRNLNSQVRGRRVLPPRATRAVPGPVASQPTKEQEHINTIEDWVKTVSPPTEERNTINKKDDGKKRKTSDGLEQDVMKAAKLGAEAKEQSSPRRSRPLNYGGSRSPRSLRRDPLPSGSLSSAKQLVETPKQADSQSRLSPLTPHLVPVKKVEDDGDKRDSLPEGPLSNHESQPSNTDSDASKQRANTPQTTACVNEEASRTEDESEALPGPASYQALQKDKADTTTQAPSTETKPLDEPEDGCASGSSSKEHIDAVKQDHCEEPIGFKNYHRACFAIAALQCLLGVPELADRYEPFAFGTVSELKFLIDSLPDTANKEKWEEFSDELATQMEAIRDEAEICEADISMGAYYGALIEKIKASDGDAVISPFEFLQAFGARFPNDTPWNGEEPQEARGFINALLDLLHYEEAGAQGVHQELTLVQKLFGVRTRSKLGCQECRDIRMVEPRLNTGFETWVPRRERGVNLFELLKERMRASRLDDYQCDKCKVRNSTFEQPQRPKFSKYLIVQAERIRPYLKPDGKPVVDENKATKTGKVHTEINVPGKMIDLSGLVQDGKQDGSMRYELFGMVNHIGSGGDDDEGHYIALRKIGEHWWLCDDEKIRKLSDSPKDQSRFNEGTIFFFKKME